MDLSSYILQGLSILPKKNVTITGHSSSIEALFNQGSYRDNKALGGYDQDQEAILYIETSLLTNPKALKGKLLIMDDETWRIVVVRYGEYVTHLSIISTDTL